MSTATMTLPEAQPDLLTPRRINQPDAPPAFSGKETNLEITIEMTDREYGDFNIASQRFDNLGQSILLDQIGDIDRDRSSVQPDSRSMVMVIKTNDPATAKNKINNLLKTHGVHDRATVRDIGAFVPPKTITGRETINRKFAAEFAKRRKVLADAEAQLTRLSEMRDNLRQQIADSQRIRFPDSLTAMGQELLDGADLEDLGKRYVSVERLEFELAIVANAVGLAKGRVNLAREAANSNVGFRVEVTFRDESEEGLDNSLTAFYLAISNRCGSCSMFVGRGKVSGKTCYVEYLSNKETGDAERFRRHFKDAVSGLPWKDTVAIVEVNDL